MNKLIKAVFLLLFLSFFAFLLIGQNNLSQIEPKSLQDISLWLFSPSAVLPFSTLSKVLYYLFFGFFTYFDASIASFYKFLDIGFYLGAFLYYLVYSRKQLKDDTSYLFFVFVFSGAYFLFPGGIFWLFCLVFFLRVVFPRLKFIFMPLLLFIHFPLGLVVNLVIFTFGIFDTKKRDIWLGLSFITVLAASAYLLFIDYYFYAFSALMPSCFVMFFWQLMLFALLTLFPKIMLYLQIKLKAVFVLPLVFILLFSLKLMAPFDIFVAEEDSVNGVGKLLVEHDFSEGDLILLDNSQNAKSFFLTSGINPQKFVFADFNKKNLLLFKQYLRHIAISYLVMQDGQELFGLDGVFAKEDENTLRLDNLSYHKIYADTVYQVWQLDTEKSTNLQSGAILFDNYKYLPQNLRLGAERMRKMVNGNSFDYMALTALGRIYAELLTFDKAKKWIRKSIALRDNYADSYLHLAFAYTLEYSLKPKRPYHLYFMAKHLYLRGMSLEGANHEYYHLLGDLEEYRGNESEALKYSKQALALSENKCDPSHYRLALFEIKNGNEEKAKKHLKTAIKNAPTHSGDTPDKYQALLDTLD